MISTGTLQRAKHCALWSRCRAELLLGEKTVPPVQGIDLLVVGHTPLTQPTLVENVLFLDTGAVFTECKDAALSLLQVHPEMGRITIVPTYGYDLGAELTGERGFFRRKGARGVAADDKLT